MVSHNFLGEELHIHLDEQLILPSSYNVENISSNGFSYESQENYFTFRDFKVMLQIRRSSSVKTIQAKASHNI